MSPKSRSTTVYVCSVCGEEYLVWQGRCGNCNNWNTLKEFKLPSGGSGRAESGPLAVPVRLESILKQKIDRLPTGFAEADRVLGGGIVPGSVILLGGDPGIGKSTLLLQIVEKVAAQDPKKSVLYVSGEESPQQIKLRAERLGVQAGPIQLLAETSVNQVTHLIEQERPALVIIDSIQTMYDPAFPSTPGSLVQVRESALCLQQAAKSQDVPVVLVGHITKEGTIAGPRTLEHLVDVVLYLEGDAQHELRILRAVKNRFGDSSETGIFNMRENGLAEVANPGDFLLAERGEAPGSVLSAIMEGSRPMLIEVQALTTPSVFGYPRRTASGFDLNRLNLLLAVLQRRAGINLSNQDVFINIIGGIRVKEPAVDAAICVALASVQQDKALAERLCVIGEVGLAGELRRVSQQERRLKEIESLGYQVPKNLKNLRQLIEECLGR